MPTVHGVPLSPFVRKVLVGLIEKGQSYDVNPVVPFPPANDAPEFRAMSPLGKVPAYEDGDFAISDSSVILDYLERKQPNPPLYPSSPEENARTKWFEELADSKLAEGIGPVFFQRIVGPKMMNQPTDQAVVDNALNVLIPPLFDYLEGQLGDADYLVAGRFGVADIAVGSMLRQFQIAGEAVDGGRWPKLAAYCERVLSRPSFKACADEENKIAQSMS